MELTRELDIIIPASFVSRSSTFKEKIEAKLGGIIQFYRPLHVEISDRHTIIIPTRYQSHRISQLAETVDDEAEFLALVHVALIIRLNVMNKIAKSKKLL